MAVDAVHSLVDALRQYRILEPIQLHEVTQTLQGLFQDPEALAQELVSRGWLTLYQSRQLQAQKGQDLLLGSYIIMDRQGEGPMGSLFKARHIHMRRAVALQVIREDLLAEPAAVERFYQQVQAASQLSDPHIVHSFDAGPVGNTHFFAVEFVAGIPLDRLIQEQGPIAVERACSYVYQTAKGLQHAFERGMLHRDLKPSNLLVLGVGGDGSAVVDAHTLAAPGGLVKIRNLGLTLLQPLAPESLHMKWATDAIDYLAPELANGDSRADVRSDLYSLGCIMHFLLTGQPPFPDGAAEEKLRRHREAPPPAIDGLPGAVAGVWERLLAKQPEERFATPGEVADALGAHLGLDSGSRRPAPAPRSAPVPAAEIPNFDNLETSMPGPRPRARPRTPRSRRWVMVNLVGISVLVLMFGVFAILLIRQQRQANKVVPSQPASADASQTEWNNLLAAAPATDLAQQRLNLLSFRQTFPGSSHDADAGRMLAQMPSPLDALDPSGIGPDQHVGNLPTQVVAVIGDGRNRYWGPIHGLAFHPDGKRLAVGASEPMIRIWDTTRQTDVERLTASPGATSRLVFSQDGRQLVAGGNDGLIRIWDVTVTPAQMKNQIKAGVNQVLTLALSPDGKQIACGGRDRNIRLWATDADANAKPIVLEGHGDAITALAFSPDDLTLASASSDKTIRLWNLAQASPVSRDPLQGHNLGVQNLAFSPDGRFLASSGADRQVLLWDVQAGQLHDPKTLPEFREGATALAFTPDGKSLVTGGLDGTIRIWQWNAGKPAPKPATVSSGPNSIQALALSPTAPILAAAGLEQVVRLWNLTPQGPQAQVSVRPWPAQMRAAVLAPGCQGVVLGGSDGTLRSWQVEGKSLKERIAWPGLSGPITALAFHPVGRILAVGHADGPVRMWDMLNQRPIERKLLVGHRGPVTRVAFTPDGDRVVSVGQDRMGALWPVFGSQVGEIAQLRTIDSPMLALAIAASGQMLATVNMAGDVVRWDIAQTVPQYHKVAAVPMGRDQVAAFAAQGTVLAVGSSDGKVRLWDLAAATAGPLKVLDAVTGPLVNVSFSLDGRLLVAAGASGQVVWWNAQNWEPVDRLQLPGPIHDLTLASDSRHAVTANLNGTAFVLRLASPPAPSP